MYRPSQGVCAMFKATLLLHNVHLLSAGQSIVVEFAESSYSVSEGAGEVVLIVTANGTSAVNYTVVVDTVDGRATGK